MKILFVTPYYYPKIGGLENYVYNLVNELLKYKNIEIVVVTSNNDPQKYVKEKLHNGKVTVYRLPIKFKLSNTPINFKWFIDMKKIINKEKPNIINAHSPVPFISDVAFWCKGKIPFIITYHAGSMIKNKFYIDWFISLYEGTFLKYIFKKSDKIIYISPQFLKSHLQGFKDKLFYIPPGVDTSFFKATNKKDNNTVIYVGKIEKSSDWKGLYVLLDAIKLLKKGLPKIHLNIVGSGDAIHQYKQYCKDIKIIDNVSFLGELKDKKLVQHIDQSSVLVLPSLTNAESFGMVLIEAMSCQTPVIGSKIGGIPYVIDNNVNGLLVQPGSAKSLASAIKKILTDKTIQKVFGLNGRKKVLNNFSWQINASKFKTAINSINNNIYQITPYYPPHLGGLQNCVQELARRFSLKGYNVTVLTSNVGFNGSNNTVNDNDVLVKYLDSKEIAHTPLSFALISELLKISNRSLLHIHISNAYFPEISYIIATLKRLKYIVHYHIDVEGSGLLGFLLPIYKKILLSHVIKNASRIICLTESQKKIIHAKYNVKLNKIEIIPNGVNQEFFMKRGEASKTIRLLYVGRITKQKNITRLIEAMHLLKHDNYSLDIVGDGDERELITKLINAYNLKNINLHGKQTGDKLVEFYRNSDIFVLPSDNEGMSLSLLEAMAAELPIITTSLPQSKDFLGKGALLVENPTPEKYAQAIKTLAQNQSLREKMSQYNGITAKQYSWNSAVLKIEKIYNELLV